MNDECKVISPESKFVYVVMGKPIAWARAGNCNGRFYDKQKHAKLGWGFSVAAQHATKKLFTTSLHLDATFYFHIPKTHAKKRDKMMGKLMPHTPDLDNLLKFICDACGGILYKDDAIVCSFSARKVWGQEGKTEFSFTEIE